MQCVEQRGDARLHVAHKPLDDARRQRAHDLRATEVRQREQCDATRVALRRRDAERVGDLLQRGGVDEPHAYRELRDDDAAGVSMLGARARANAVERERQHDVR
jgi:hypothetical protein